MESFYEPSFKFNILTNLCYKKAVLVEDQSVLHSLNAF